MESYLKDNEESLAASAASAAAAAAAAAAVAAGAYTRSLQINLSRFGHTSPCPPV